MSRLLYLPKVFESGSFVLLPEDPFEDEAEECMFH